VPAHALGRGARHAAADLPYPADRGWDFWNLISLRRGPPVGSDPWDAWTLEWATASPPPPYNFETAPVVESRRPLWDLKHPDDPDGPHE